MEGLRDVADVVDQQSESIRLSKVGAAWVQVVRDVRVHIRSLVISAVLARKPVSDVLDTKSQIARSRPGDVPVACSSLINIGNIDKVEIRLPGTTVVFDIVSKGCAFDERVIQLVRCECRVVVTERLKHSIGCVPAAYVIL